MSAPEGWADRIRAEVLDQRRQARRRSQDTAQAILRGEIQVPLRCDHCKSPSWLPEEDVDHREYLVCLQCSRYTTMARAHEARKEEIRMIIAAGVDPRPTNRRGV